MEYITNHFCKCFDISRVENKKGLCAYIQNFNGSNTFGTIKICSRQAELELMSVNHRPAQEA